MCVDADMWLAVFRGCLGWVVIVAMISVALEGVLMKKSWRWIR